MTYQTVRFGSPDLETATAIQALALALSASRSARQGALSFRPPAAMYCFAISPSERQFPGLVFVAFIANINHTSVNGGAQLISDRIQLNLDQHADINDMTARGRTMLAFILTDFEDFP